MAETDYNGNYNSDASESEFEIRPMRNGKKKRILESESEYEDNSGQNYSKKFKKRSRIIELLISSSDEDDAKEECYEVKKVSYLQKLRKFNRNSGKKYYTKCGKIIPEKKFVNKNCQCSRACAKSISEEERKQNFNEFWNLADFNKQNLFLLANTRKLATKRKRPRNFKGVAKSYSFKYYLSTNRGDILVCKTYFLHTFNISKGRLDRALKAEVVGKDLRGQSEGSSRKTNENLVNDVKHHIQSFPQFESHYTRNHNPERKYLNPELNIRKMYNLYVDECKLNKRPNVNEWTYRNIFKTQFNLHFHHPRTDTCQKCDMLSMKIKTSCNIQEQQSLTEQHEIHLINAEIARKSLQEDRDKALNNPEKYFAFSFDLQKALPYPKLTVSSAYYKRNMYVLNQGVHNFHNDEVNMYVWDETIASRGSQEVASCCLKHLQTVTTQKHIIAYSDMCTGQNRNIKLALMWMKIVQSSDNEINIIDHKFLLSGHSYLPNDSDFGVVEKAIRKTNSLYIPQDYYKVMRNCRKQKKFLVHEMKRENFFSTQPLEKAVFKRKKNTDGEPVNWLSICWIRFTRDAPYKMLYKTSIERDAEFKIIDLSPQQGRPSNFGNIKLPFMYGKRRPITSEKKKDMMDLLPYIPPIHHEYFKMLSPE